MRYYRLWIYLCNLILMLGMFSFCLLAATFLNDPRSQMISLSMNHPTFIYAYGSLVTQGIILPAIGFYGAVTLNQKWLRIYWFGLTATLIGDVVIGVSWIFLYYNLKLKLANDLLNRLNNDYIEEPQFTTQWNDLQSRFECCGVYGPLDFNGTLIRNSDNLTKSCSASSDITDGNATPVVTSDMYIKLHVDGCLNVIVDWLSHCVHVLYVVGFCVIDFLKLCLLLILRYEIREMVQKIKILQGDMSAIPELITLGLHAPVLHAKHRLMPDYTYNRPACPIRRKRSIFNFDGRKSMRIERARKRLKIFNQDIEMSDIKNINVQVKPGQQKAANASQ
ncbi:hypothetical protein CHUAL_012418 [Chamberlinius hualienensis]